VKTLEVFVLLVFLLPHLSALVITLSSSECRRSLSASFGQWTRLYDVIGRFHVTVASCGFDDDVFGG